LYLFYTKIIVYIVFIPYTEA